MKKVLSLLLALALIFSFVACSKENDTSSDNKSNITQGKDGKEKTESENTIVNSSTEPSSEDSTPNETSNQEPVPNNTPSNNVVSNSNSNVIKTFTPKVIASRCSHNYLPPTCTSLVPCTICGELLFGLYQGQKIEYGHIYNNNKCVWCGYERKGTLELSGSFFAINQPITIDIRLDTSAQEIEIYPCVALYKYVNGNWEPYTGLYDANEFFALEATQGEVLESNGVKYGRWDYMNNNILKTDPNAIIENDFSTPRLIRRFKLSIPETGEYKVEVTDGPNNSKYVSGQSHSYIINTY